MYHHKSRSVKQEQKAVKNPNEPDDAANSSEEEEEEEATAYLSESGFGEEDDLRVDDDQN